MSKELIEKYAYKFLASSNKEVNKKNVIEALKNCVITPKQNMIEDIVSKINELKLK